MTLATEPTTRAAAAATARRRNLARLLRPRHIAVVGGREAATVIRQCRSVGFTGPIWPVNPRRAELEGLPCYAAVGELPEAPDAVFLAVPARANAAVVAELAARGAGGCVCYAAGFAEVGPGGAALQRDLAAAAGEMALVGPNCFGLLNYLDGAALWPDAHGGGAVDRGVVIVTQSGNIGINLTMQDRSLPIGYVISIGNQAGLGFADYVSALIEDERVSAIGLYVEGLTDIPGFARSAARALERGVPLVALKSGSSEVGARVAYSHTSALAGTDVLYDALFRRLGIARVQTLSAFLETLKLLALTGPLPGRRLGLMSCSGGEASLFADLASASGFTLPRLDPGLAAELRAQLPDFATVDNPLDYNTAIWGDRAALERCFATMLASGFDCGLLVVDYPRAGVPDTEAWGAALDAFLAAVASTGARAAVMSTLSELLPAEARARAADQGVAPLQGLGEAVIALGAAAFYGEARAARAGADADAVLPPVPPLPPTAVVLDEAAAKQRLAAAGVPVPLGRAVAIEDAAATAAELGFPVAVKGLAPGLAHKSELDAVRLNLDTPNAVARAAREVQALLPQPPGRAPRVLVEAMVTDAVAELLVGVEADPQFGLALVLASGGNLVELLGDSRTLLLPASRAELEAALDSLKVARLLEGYRGRPAGDRAAALAAIQAIADFAEAERGRLVELDVNPLIVRPRGGGAVAADALIRIAQP